MFKESDQMDIVNSMTKRPLVFSISLFYNLMSGLFLCNYTVVCLFVFFLFISEGLAVAVLLSSILFEIWLIVFALAITIHLLICIDRKHIFYNHTFCIGYLMCMSHLSRCLEVLYLNEFFLFNSDL